MIQIKTFILYLIFIGYIPTLIGQQAAVNRENYQLHIENINSEILLDGQLNDEAWINAQKADKFHMVLPIDEGQASSQSEVMMARNESNLYIAITCFDTVPGKRPVESLRRDFSFGQNDNFIVFIDTYNDQTNGFAFGISAAGAQWEGIQADGGFVSLNWDTKWKSKVKNYEDRWIAEFEIPYRSIRYKDGAKEWGINFARLDLKTGEKSAWAPVPRQFQTANLAFTGTLKWNDPLPKRGVTYSIIPYVFAQSTKNIEDQLEGDVKFKAGFDAKITVSTSLNLDLSLNPDFSQVEVDQQQINLERFELFFPERRQFFLENSDLFASLGSDGNRPFFSRRIGLKNPVLGGARLSGKLTKKTRIGLMNMQTGTKENVAAGNFLVGVVQQQIFARSNVSFFVVNKQITDQDFTSIPKYNRVFGVDANLSSSDSRWTGKVFYHQSLSESITSDAFSLSGNVAYDTPKFKIALSQNYIGDDYNAEVGFIRRKGIYKTSPNAQYKFFPKSGIIANHGPGIKVDFFLDKEIDLRDRISNIFYLISFKDRSSLVINFEDNFIKLIDSFDPTNSGGEELIRDSKHNWQRISMSYHSNSRDLFNYAASVGYGGFFNGTRLSLIGDISYRVQPYAKLSILTSYNKVELPEPYNSANFVLFGPKLDITFTDKIFLTTFTQYNNQIDNVNLNIRFQWRFAPGSDLFIVFTQNSYPENFDSKNRGLVGKFSYWFN